MRRMNSAEIIDFQQTAQFGGVYKKPEPAFEQYRSLREYAVGGVAPRVDAPAWDPETAYGELL